MKHAMIATWVMARYAIEEGCEMLSKGKDAADAIEMLEEQGFKPLKRKEPSYVLEPGLVTRTDPAAKTKLNQSSDVDSGSSKGLNALLGGNAAAAAAAAAQGGMY